MANISKSYLRPEGSSKYFEVKGFLYISHGKTKINIPAPYTIYILAISIAFSLFMYLS